MRIQVFFIQNIHIVTYFITICSIGQITQNNQIIFVQKDNKDYVIFTIDNRYKHILPTALIYQPIMNKSRTSKRNGNMSQKNEFC